MATRIPIIVGAYLAACFAAGMVFWSATYLQYALDEDFFSLVLYASGGGLFIGIYIAIFALLPTLPGIIYAERASVRFFLFYGVSGALVGILSYGLYALVLILSAGTAEGFLGGTSARDFGMGIALFGGPGLVGGLVYWLIA